MVLNVTGLLKVLIDEMSAWEIYFAKYMNLFFFALVVIVAVVTAGV